MILVHRRIGEETGESLAGISRCMLRFTWWQWMKNSRRLKRRPSSSVWWDDVVERRKFQISKFQIPNSCTRRAYSRIPGMKYEYWLWWRVPWWLWCVSVGTFVPLLSAISVRLHHLMRLDILVPASLPHPTTPMIWPGTDGCGPHYNRATTTTTTVVSRHDDTTVLLLVVVPKLYPQ